MILKPENKVRLLWQFIKFGFIGITNTIVFWCVATGITCILNDMTEKAYVFGNTAAFIVSVMWSFFWNMKYVFKCRDNKPNYFVLMLKFYGGYAFTGIILNNILSWIWIERLCWSYMIAPLLNSIIGLPINFAISKFWVFSN